MAVALLAAIALPSPAAAASRAERPNVVVIMTDDQDFRSMRVMPKTRRLIGREGITFDRNVRQLPALLPVAGDVLDRSVRPQPRRPLEQLAVGRLPELDGSETLPVWLSRAGYRTIHIGKYLNEYGEQKPTEVPKGWDDWHGGVDPSTYDYYGYHDQRQRRR